MSNGISFPNFSGQPGMRFETMVVNENSAISSSAFTTVGLDTRGSFLATIKKTSAGHYSVLFNVTYADAPVVLYAVQTASRAITLTPSTTGFTFITTDFSGTVQDDAVISFFLCIYTSNQVFA
jgi:hypothetical protein